MRKIKPNKWILTLLFVIGILLILTTPLQRTINGNPLTPGEETYLHLNNINNGNLNLYELLINALHSLMSFQIMIFAVPLILSLLSSILFYLIIKSKVKTELELYFSMAIMFLTPAFISIHLGLTIYAFALTLTLATIHLYNKKIKIYFLTLFLLYFLIPFLSIILFMILLSQTSFKQKKIEFFSLFTFLGITIGLGFFVNFIESPLKGLIINFMPNQIFNFLGGIYGFVMFSFILGFAGLYSPKNNLLSVGQRSLITLLLILSLFYEPLRILFIPFIAFFAAKSLQDLMSQKWSIPYLKDLTVLLFICMLLFATISGVKENNNQTPTTEQKEAYQFLNTVKNQNPEIQTTKILSNPSYSSQLTYFSKLNAYATINNQNEIDLANNLLESRDYDYIKEQFNKYDIAFVYIDTLMMEEQILNRNDKGIIFVMENNPNFKLIYNRNNERIYFFTLWNEK